MGWVLSMAVGEGLYDDAPVLKDARLLARLSRGTRVVLLQLSERVNCGFSRSTVPG
jgi:hypothetical protein